MKEDYIQVMCKNTRDSAVFTQCAPGAVPIWWGARGRLNVPAAGSSEGGAVEHLTIRSWPGFFLSLPRCCSAGMQPP